MPVPMKNAVRYYDHYPYEKLTDKATADIARKQDRHITDLKHENQCLKDELYAVKEWRKRVIPILEANNINIDEITSIITATRGVFGE